MKRLDELAEITAEINERLIKEGLSIHERSHIGYILSSANEGALIGAATAKAMDEMGMVKRS